MRLNRATCAPMRGPAYETMFALLAGLGLRIGEVARLQCGDVDLEREALQIRDTKFGKSRLVPFGPKLSARLRVYLGLRERRGMPCSGAAPLFSWNGRQPVSTNAIRNTFRDDLLPQRIRPAKSSCGSELAQGCSCPRHFIADTWTLQESSCRAGGHGAGIRRSSESRLYRRAGSPACRSQPLPWPTA